MAKTFTLTSSSYQGRYLEAYCTQEIDIANNKSKITWTLSSKGGSSNYYSTGPTTLNIANSQVYYKARVNWDDKIFPAAKGSVSGVTYVDHDTQGKKTISVELKTAIYAGSSSVKTYSNTWQLDDIPRQATLESAPAEFWDDSDPEITYKNPAGNAVSSLDACISFTGAKDDIPYRPISKTGTSYIFDFKPEEIDTLRNATPTGKRDVIFYVRTIIGGKTFYSTSTKKLKIRETDNTRPSVTMTATLNNGNLPSTFAEMYIQGKSRLNITLTAKGKYSASISSYSASVGSDSYSGSSITTNAITKSGDIDVIGYAKDSRGFTGSASKKISVLAYSKPLVIPVGNDTAILCYRSDGNGVRTGNSTSVWIKAKRSYYSLSGKNTCALQWRRRLTSSGTWSAWYELIPKSNTSTSEYNALLTGGDEKVFELNKSYVVQIRAIDDIGEYDIKEFEIPTQDVALHLGAGGKNVAVGTYCDYSEPYTFYSDWKAIFDKGVYLGSDQYPIFDVVIEQNTSGIWTYEKWLSGKAVCWGVKNVGGVDVTKAWNNLYESTSSYSETYPNGLFIDIPHCYTEVFSDNGLMKETYTDSTKSQTPKIYFVRPYSAPIDNAKIYFYAIGRWK